MNSTAIYQNNQLEEQPEAPVKLPVHLPTLFLGVRSRRRLLVVFAAGSLLLGLAGGRLFGKKSFAARTVLLYRQPPSGSTLPAGEVDETDTPTLLTQMDMVKIDANLEEVRRRLRLKGTAESLGRTIKVDVPINSSLMTITVTTDDAKRASDIANASRDAFLQEELGIQHAQAAGRVADLLARQDKVMSELRAAEQNLKDFTIRNHVVDLDKEAGWYLQQLINTELVYEEAVGQNNASQLQQSNIEKIASSLEGKVQAEEAQINGGSASHGDSSTRAPDDDAIRGRVADLKMKEIDMNRARTLADDGIYSKREYEKAKAAYEQERFLLYKDSPSASLYKEMTLRELDVQLAHISDRQKVAHLREAVDHVHERLDSLPLVQRDYLALSREVAIRATEREHIDQLLGLARRENESQSLGFSVVSVATPPLLPLNSNRKLVFVSLSVVGTLLGFLVALLLELFDRRLRCVGDARAKLGSEVLAGFQHGEIERGDVTDESLALVNRLRHLGMNAGSKVMIVSATPGEGAPEVTRLLALTFASAGDPTLLVDARFREVHTAPPTARVFIGWRKRIHVVLQHLKPELFFPTVKHSEASLSVSAGSHARPGISDLLANPEDRRDLCVHFQKDVRLLPAGQIARPELLLSRRLNPLLEANMHKSEVLLVNAAPVRDYPDATFLAPCISSAIMVAAAGKVTAEDIGRCIGLLTDSGISVLGVVITNIAEAFSEKRLA